MEVRPVRPDEHGEAGKLVVAAYEALPGRHLSGGYADELAAVARRSLEAEVLVAVGEAPGLAGAARPAAPAGARPEIATLLGCVTLVPGPESPWAELLEPGEAGMRMLAVLPSAQRSGVGRALVRACVSRSRELGRHSLLLHTTPWMTAAHRLYRSLDFERVPERDWLPDPDVPLLAYRLPLG